MIDAGGNRRTLIFIRDLCEAAVTVADHPKAAGETFNVTDGAVHTFREIVHALCDALERSRPRRKMSLSLLRRIAGALEVAADAVGWRVRLGRAAIDNAFGDIAVSGEKIQRWMGFRSQYGLLRGWRETIAELGSR
jgi:nucleoside-diphosphate-sugar epimerase